MTIASTTRLEHTEGKVAKSIEEQTAKLPSDTFLWAAVGSMILSATFQAAGNKNASVFVGFADGPVFEFEEWIVPRRQLELDGLRLKIVSHERSSEASRWRVSADAVAAFASM